MLFSWKNEIDEITACAQDISPEFYEELKVKFLDPYLLGCRFYTFRQALNRYLNVCVASIENPYFDSIDLRRCLADEGDVFVWARHIGREIFPVLLNHTALLHWHQVAPVTMR